MRGAAVRKGNYKKGKINYLLVVAGPLKIIEAKDVPIFLQLKKWRNTTEKRRVRGGGGGAIFLVFFSFASAFNIVSLK